MPSRFSQRLETYVGIALLLVAVLGFILSILSSLPDQEAVNAKANVLEEIPRNMFDSQNPQNQLLQKLNTPSGVPVTVDPNTLGRSSVFENF